MNLTGDLPSTVLQLQGSREKQLLNFIGMKDTILAEFFLPRSKETNKQKKSLSFLCLIAHLSSSGNMVHWEKWKSVFPDPCLIIFPFLYLSFTGCQKIFLDCCSLWIKLFTHVFFGVHFLYIKAMQNLFSIQWNILCQLLFNNSISNNHLNVDRAFFNIKYHKKNKKDQVSNFPFCFPCFKQQEWLCTVWTWMYKINPSRKHAILHLCHRNNFLFCGMT